MLEWTKARGDEARCETLVGKELQLCFLIDTTHTKLDNLDKLGISCCNLARHGSPN